MNKTPLLKLENISKAYRNADGSVAAEVFSHLDLNLYPGETVAVTGPSGCGKSTLLNICGTLLTSDSGRMEFNGMETKTWTEKEIRKYRNRNLGFIFQNHRLLPQLTLLENILLPLQASPVKKEQWEMMTERARDLLAEVGLADKGKRFPGQVSVGESQRAATARALLLQPELILADEPTGALDRENAARTAELVLELCRKNNSAVLLVTHSLQLAGMMERQLPLAELCKTGRNK